MKLLDNEIETEAEDLTMSKDVGDALNKAYPNWAWAVHANTVGGVVDIWNPALDMKYGFRLMISDINNDPALRCVLRAGGEMLERFKMNRGKFNLDDWMNAQRDVRGILVGDNS
jgi:hypothetical protein